MAPVTIESMPVSSLPFDHEQVVELLPDYAIGALEPAELDRVALHLETCAACRAELVPVLELGALISNAAPPAAAVRRQLLEEATSTAAPTSDSGIEPGRDQPTPMAIPRSRPVGGAGRPRRAQAVLAAAAALLIIGLGIWNLRLRDAGQEYESIAGIMSSATVYPLTESQLTPPASGVLLVGADDRSALLIANDLPPIAAGEELRIWLVDERGQSAAVGVLAADAAGRAQTELSLAQPLSAYVAVAVSAEPAAGGAEPSGPLALGGWLGTP